MYQNTAAIIRPEIMAVVEEAAMADAFFVAEALFPVTMRERKTGEYRKVVRGKSQLLAKNPEEALNRAPRTAYAKVDRTYEKDSYKCIDRGVTEDIDDSERRDNPSFDEEVMAAKLCLRTMRISQEARVAAAVMSDTNWGTPYASKAVYSEANIATIDFIKDMKQLLKIVRMRGEGVNTIAMNGDLWDLIQRSTLLRSHLYGNNGGGTITPEVVAKDLRIDQIVIAEATYDKTPKTRKSTDEDLSYIWPGNRIWVGAVAAGDFSAGGAGRILVWEEDAPGLYITETYRNEETRSDTVRVRQHTDEKVINEMAGVLLDTTTAE